MKHKLLGLRIIIGLCTTLCWFGFLYPELTTNASTVRVIYEDGTDASDDYPDSEELYKELMKTSRKNVRYRSKLFTNLSALWEAFYGAD